MKRSKISKVLQIIIAEIVLSSLAILIILVKKYTGTIMLPSVFVTVLLWIIFGGLLAAGIWFEQIKFG